MTGWSVSGKADYHKTGGSGREKSNTKETRRTVEVSESDWIVDGFALMWPRWKNPHVKPNIECSLEYDG